MHVKPLIDPYSMTLALCPVCRGRSFYTDGQTRRTLCQQCGETIPSITDLYDYRAQEARKRMEDLATLTEWL